MSDRNKLLVLLVLVGVFVAVNLRNSITPAATSISARPPQAGGKSGSRIPDADLNLAALDTASQMNPAEAKRNIFQYGQANLVVQRPKVTKVEDPTPPPPPPPPPPPVRFFGLSQSSAGGQRRVFLTNGEETFIVREGDVFMKRYRLVRVGNDNVEIEEIGGPNRWVVPREQQ